MSAFANLPVSGAFSQDCILNATLEDCARFARYTAKTSDEEYFSLGFSKTVFHIRPDSLSGLALAPDLDTLGHISYVDDNLVNYLSKKKFLGSLEYLFRLNHSTITDYNHKSKIDSQRRLLQIILGFDQLIKKEAGKFIASSYDQSLISSDCIRSPHWHPDETRTAARIYTVRASNPDGPSVSTEYLLDCPQRLRPQAMQLVDEIESRQNEVREKIAPNFENVDYKERDNMVDAAIYKTLGGEVYADWKRRALDLDLFFQPAAYDVVLSTDRTFHRSHVPEKPTASGFLRATLEACDEPNPI